MSRFRIAFIAAAIMAAPMLALAGCAGIFSPIADPASVGCTQPEANACRVISAALIVKAANITIGEQLDKGLVSVDEAKRLRGLTLKAEAALDAARAVLPLGGGAVADRLAALDALLVQLLAEQAIKRGAVT